MSLDEIDLLPPGQEPTREDFNNLAEKVNRRLKGAGSAALGDSFAGQSITQARDIEPIYGVLVAWGVNDKEAHHYAFIEVYTDPDGTDGEWIEKPDGIQSFIDREFAPKILNPAVEINHIKGIDLNTVVRLYPAERLSTDEHDRSYLEWFFSADPGLKAFALDEDLIPTGGGELDTSVIGHFLSDPDMTQYDLYPAAPIAFDDQAEGAFSLGIGRGPGGYSTGTWGWAKWVDRARKDELSGEVLWEGQWQVVTLYAQLIADVRVYNKVSPGLLFDDAIAPGETGTCQLWWVDIDQQDFAMTNSTYTLEVTNNLEVPIMHGSRLRVEFNRHDYRWYPLHLENQEPYGIVQALPVGGNAAGTVKREVSFKACNWEGADIQVDLDTAWTQIRDDCDTHVFVGDIFRYNVEPDGTKVITSPYVLGPVIGAIRQYAVDLAAPAVTRLNEHGWWLQDTTHGTEDAVGRFFMGVDVADAIGDASESVIGNTDGHLYHGLTENNHTDHPVETHNWGSGTPDDEIDTPTDKLEDHPVQAHDGPHNGGQDTDNRPRYVVTAPYQYTGVP